MRGWVAHGGFRTGKWVGGALDVWMRGGLGKVNESKVMNELMNVATFLLFCYLVLYLLLFWLAF